MNLTFDKNKIKEDVGGVMVEKQIGSPKKLKKESFRRYSNSLEEGSPKKEWWKKEKMHKQFKSGKKKFKWWYIPLGILVILIVVSLFFGNRILATLRSMGVDVGLSDLTSFLSSPEQMDQTDGRTNFLLVGIDTRPGFGLMNTDTLMVISYDYDTKEVAMISIPRDTNVEYYIDDYRHVTKINSTYWRAESEYGEGQGMPFLEERIQEVTGLPIHYSAMVNYYAFVQAIDELGGVDICVERTFTDYRYPKPGSEPGSSVSNEHITVHFDEGCQHMDGETALMYARSRKGNNGEGSDYARAARQQKVVQAVYGKFADSSFFSKFDSTLAFLDILGDNVQLYDIDTEDMRAAWGVREEAKIDDMSSLVLSPGIDHWRLINGYHPEAGTGEWWAVNSYVQFFLDHPSVYKEDATIGIYDGGAGYTETTAVRDKLNEAHLYAVYKSQVSMDNCSSNILGVVAEDAPANETMLYAKELVGGTISTDLPVEGSSVDVVIVVCSASE